MNNSPTDINKVNELNDQESSSNSLLQWALMRQSNGLPIQSNVLHFLFIHVFWVAVNQLISPSELFVVESYLLDSWSFSSLTLLMSVGLLFTFALYIQKKVTVIFYFFILHIKIYHMLGQLLRAINFVMNHWSYWSWTQSLIWNMIILSSVLGRFEPEKHAWV